jgi:hypothetical protein
MDPHKLDQLDLQVHKDHRVFKVTRDHKDLKVFREM